MHDGVGGDRLGEAGEREMGQCGVQRQGSLLRAWWRLFGSLRS
jgi:hypothetical protein